ncbi:MAG: LacI family DNA-binding transcriptional regulator [Oscillospiraceae bacterium]|nr:LacI family DNA-binding transcriptional regulator [Oscillospiraceae bacterium]
MSTIREVAKLANVSTATVSRIINNDTKYKITDATRERVWEAVRALDYSIPVRTPKQSKEVNVQNTPHKIGCILSVTKKKYNDPYFMSIFSGIEKRLQEKGCVISFIKTGAELVDRNALISAFQEPVAGMIMMETLNPEQFEYVKTLVPHIVGIDTMQEGIDNVGYDHYQAALLTTRYLISRGHKKIGFVGGSGGPADLMNSRRFQGYYIAMSSAGLPVEEKWTLNCQWDEDLCAAQVDTLCQSGDMPTAIVAASDLMAIVTMNSLFRNGLSVPNDVAVVGISNIDMSKYTTPPLTTIHIPTEEIGIVAADMLLSRINGNDVLPQKILLPISLLVRGSV